jgi:hypothetical protein
MKIAMLLLVMITLNGCAVKPLDKDKIEQYPNCVREGLFKKSLDDNCVVRTEIKEKEQNVIRDRNARIEQQRNKERAENAKWEAEWEAERKNNEALEAKEIAKFKSLPGLTYDEFITKVIGNPDNIGWISKVKTRYGRNAPFIPTVKQQIGPNKYIVQSMFYRDNPNKFYPGHKGRLLLVNSRSTLIVDMPIDQPHTLRYEGVTTTNTVMGSPIQVIAVTLIK